LDRFLSGVFGVGFVAAPDREAKTGVAQKENGKTDNDKPRDKDEKKRKNNISVAFFLFQEPRWTKSAPRSTCLHTTSIPPISLSKTTVEDWMITIYSG